MKRIVFLVAIVLVQSFVGRVSAGLIAYWPFDTDPNNAQDNKALDGKLMGKAVVSGENVAVGTGALKIDDDKTSASYVDITSTVLTGNVPTVNTVVVWYQYKDISGNGSDARNFIYETDTTWTLSFGIGDVGTAKRAQWFFSGTASQSSNINTGPVVSDPNTWHHAAVVWNRPAGYIKFYHDGQLWGNPVPITAGSLLMTPKGFHIGDYRVGDGGRNWDGYIDDVAIFDNELTRTQIGALYNKTHTPATVGQLLDLRASNPNPLPGTQHINPGTKLSWQAPVDVESPTYNVYLSTDPAMVNNVMTLGTALTVTNVNLPETLIDATEYFWRVDVEDGAVYTGNVWSFRSVEGLVAYWPFDTDPNLTNIQGNSLFDGTAVGNARVSSEDVKVGNGALKIDDNTTGINYVSIKAAPIVGAQQIYTVTGWYKYSDISLNGSDLRNFVFETYPNYAASFAIRSDTTGDGSKQPQWVVSTTGAEYATAVPGAPPVNDGKWHHMAMVWDSITGVIMCYHDGTLLKSFPISPGHVLTDCSGFNIGNHRAGDGTRNWDGYIDDLAIFDNALRPVQVSALYQGIRTPFNVMEELQLKAYNPGPASESITSLDGQFSWSAPQDVLEPAFNVYLTTDSDFVNDVRTLAMGLTETSVAYPNDLVRNTKYYWRVDVVDGSNIYKGDVWSFYTNMGLVAYWPFDTDPNNAQGNKALDGKLMGKAVVSGENVAVGTGALKIDDDKTSASYVDITSTVLTGNVPTVNTVAVWYQYKDISGNGSDERNFIYETDTTWTLSFGIRDVGTVKRAQWFFSGTASQSSDMNTGPVVSDPNTWHHAAIVWNRPAGYIKFYHDGQLWGNPVPITAGSLLMTPKGFHIGDYRAGDGGRNWDGYIDDVAVFDEELSEYQVKRLVTDSTVNAGNVLNIRKIWADFNNDGDVDLEDMKYLAGKWLSNDIEADSDNSGRVDLLDFASFAESWGI